MTIELSDIRKVVSVIRIKGNDNFLVRRVIKFNPDNVDADSLMWLSDKNKQLLQSLNFGIVLCTDKAAESYTGGATLLICENPRFAFQSVASSYFTRKKIAAISPLSSIHSSVIIGRNCTIGNYVTIEEGCVIGDNVIIGHNTTILYDTQIHNDVVIGNNSTIGGVGFGYEKDPDTGKYQFIPHLGNVIIKSGVEIGNNTCVDRAVLGSTLLCENVKVDNLVHIAHGVVVGENSLVIANAMVAGSVEIGKNCWIAPSVSIINQKSVGDDVVVGIGSLVLQDVPTGATVLGVPAEEIRASLEKKNILKQLISEYKSRT